ncbi:DUF1007 family protein [Phyllobacterium sp. 21LDTY02-6]|jgi:ABC-type uncharacterized transport system substrate-binding protein|uniref:DUF1007 family protein n=1 Tax=Phyllobacterium sp. 21LDTY02-6 TaxID=2944903 RepID=UPI0020212C0B|nr:DUF1007 family protein [Phyllobacterium sp. 21LDTY02-6]MCO4315687.1 DUF1007 family protein [Phyllobacterium sp. 21LDTY02-6]
MHKRLPIFLATLALAVGFSTPAYVHPHVFAEARLDVSIKPDGTVEKLGHVWRFDDLFSSTVLVEFDKNGDLKLDQKELADLAQTINASISEFDYFQSVELNGKKIVMAAPPNIIADFQNNQLLIIFESTPKQALKLGQKTSFGVYDPTFYTAIDYVNDSDVHVKGIPATCQQKVVRPNPDEAIAQNQATLTDAFFNDPTGTDMSKIFATRLEIDCPQG